MKRTPREQTAVTLAIVVFMNTKSIEYRIISPSGEKRSKQRSEGNAWLPKLETDCKSIRTGSAMAVLTLKCISKESSVFKSWWKLSRWWE
jgi:hypothetical protein